MEDSDYCPYCGKNINVSNKAAVENSRLRQASKIVFYIGIIIFLILYIDIAPGFGWLKTFAYVAGAGIVIIAAIILNKNAKKSSTKGIYTAMIAFSACLMLFSISLRIIYESKVDTALSDIPTSGSVYVKLTAEDEYYSSTKEGYVSDPSVSVKIGETWYESGDSFKAELQQAYPIRVGCSYHIQGQVDGGYNDGTIVFTRDSLKNSYIRNETINITYTEYAEIKLTFTREITFWEVILH